jgi:bifunctional oligoribonuclease and PAP phosphatase NrnA
MMHKVLELIQAYNTIVIFGHQRPDGDCYGGQFGLKSIISENFPSKKVYVVGETSNFVSFVGTPDVISDDVFKGALCIIVDTANGDRISDSRYTLGDVTVKIDHHIDVDAYADHNFVDTSYPAVSETIAHFAVSNDLKIGLEGAKAMYVGILTDTGRFRYRGVSNRTHQMAGHLISLGLDIEEIDKQLSSESLEMMSLKGYVYSNFVTTQGGFIYIKMPKHVYEGFNVSSEDAASIVNILGGIDGYPVWAIFIEYEAEIRVRLRSNGPDINVLANAFEGGGHAKASGAKIHSWDDIERFVKETEDVIQAYKK